MNAENKFLWSLEMLTKKLAEDSVFFKGNFEAIQNDVLSPSVDVNEKKLYDEVISMFSNLYMLSEAVSENFSKSSKEARNEMNKHYDEAIKSYRTSELLFINEFLINKNFRNYSEKFAKKNGVMDEFLDYNFSNNNHDLSHLKTGGFVKRT